MARATEKDKIEADSDLIWEVEERACYTFCGRVPCSVLAKRYSDFAPEKLKEIYEKAEFKILD